MASAALAALFFVQPALALHGAARPAVRARAATQILSHADAPSLFPPADVRRSLDRELGAIALPSLAALSCENLLSLVDTLYIGRLGAVQMGAAGVGIAATYSFAKLFGDPLTKTSTSLVAGKEGDDLLSSVLAALALALFLGLVQTTAFTLFAPRIVSGFGAAATSPLAAPAASYLRLRSLGAPAVTLLLVMQGIYRGLGDTLTPLLCTLSGAAVNAVLDPILIFRFGLGCSGAAAATAVANYVSAVPLLVLLIRRLSTTNAASSRGRLRLPPARSLRSAARGYVSAGATIYVRTVGKLWGYSYAARAATSLGPVPAAAYALTFQLGVATTQLCEAVSLAMQALLSRELNRYSALVASLAGRESTSSSPTGSKSFEPKSTVATTAEAASCQANARHVLRRGLLLGGSFASALSLITWACRRAAVGALTSNLEVREAAVAVMPLVLVTQVLKGLAYPSNAVLMGGSDWLASTIAMWASSAVLVCLLTSGVLGVGLAPVWAALAACFAMQVCTAMGRVISKTGPWRVLRRS